MRIIRVPDHHAVEVATGTHQFSAETLEQAIAEMKRSHPHVTPHTCYWFETVGRQDRKRLMNTYCFVWEKR